MTQEEIPLPPPPPFPDLPEPPAYWPSTVSKYARHNVQRRDHCAVDVRILHEQGGDFAPRAAHWRRRGLPTDKEQLLLCDHHKQQYVTRDNVVRLKAGITALGGGL